MVFLHSHGVGTARAVRIFKTYGADAVQVMTENPYRLARDIRGIGFKTADAIAMRLGIEKTAMIRVRAGISYAVTEARNWLNAQKTQSSQPSGSVTVTIDNRRWRMPAQRIGIAPMTPAERQARHRAKLRQQSRTMPRSMPQRIPPRPRRWAAAVAALVDLKDEYRVWLDNLPANLEGSRLAEKLQAIAELDLEELQMIDPPRGYGRD
jgi:Helix-hairpin-helix containing domain